MNIADLFINLNLKGKNDVAKGLGGVGDQLGGIKSMSLEAKAAIVGVIYGFEQMMQKSMDMGANLSNFSTLTGIGTKELQQWRWAMEGAGGSADELQSSLRAVQESMVQIKLGKGAPESLSLLQQFTGGLSQADMDNTLVIMQRLQKLSQMSGIDPAVRNNLMKSFGVSDGVISAMRLNAFNQKALNSAPVLSSATLNANRIAKGQWSHLGTEIENSLATFNGKHGLEIVKNVEMVTKSLLKLADKLIEVSEKLHVFEAISKAFEGWAMIFEQAGFAVDNGKSAIDNIKKDSDGSWWGTVKSAVKNNTFLSTDQKTYNDRVRAMSGDYSGLVKPIRANPNKGGGDTNINVVQHNHGVKDAKEGAHYIGQEVKKVQATDRQRKVVN